MSSRITHCYPKSRELGGVGSAPADPVSNGELVGCPGSESFQVSQFLPYGPIGDGVVDLKVFMYKYVAEPRPTAQSVGQIRRQLARALENRKRIAIGIRSRQRLISYPMVGEVKAGLHHEMEVTLGKIVQCRLADELALVSFTKRFELSQVAVQCFEPSREDLRIHHRSPPP